MAESITEMLLRWGEGDQAALDRLMPMVYGELRRLAKNLLRRQPHLLTLEPTVLVHEAYLRLVNQQNVSWEHRAQFFGLAATLMRRVLVDHTRNRMAEKRGGGGIRVSLSEADRAVEEPDFELIALDDALNKLSALNRQHSQIVELRYFGGLTIEETAAVIGVSHATVERSWNMARAWLRRELTR
jgi:RNA polymerase sigma factor (TIGR02999 family)